VLFLSPRAVFAAGKAIRGGVPVIFPWFGPHPTDKSLPAHGWARTRPWTLRHAGVERDTVHLILELGVHGRTLKPVDGWVLTYTVSVGPQLRLDLNAFNATAAPMSFEAALHTYLAVGDIRRTKIDGLAGRTFIDKVDKAQRKTQPAGAFTLTGETDRVYLNTPDTVTVHDPAAGRRLVVEKSGSATTVVWNPWAEKAKAMSDFGDDEWPGMICVETANVADYAVTLAPGQTHVMRAVVQA
jgi:glucose-6-phosphate 1-epimerase